MSSNGPAPGWYSDPGQQPGMYRYWDGSAWSAAISSDPNAAPPPGSAADSGGSGGSGSGPTGPGAPGEPRRGGGGVGLWIGAGVAVVVLILVVVLAVRSLGGGGRDEPQDPRGPQPQAETCPTQAPTMEDTGPPDPADGRVHGGKLSFPTLAPPWSPVSTEYRVPFGRDANHQTVSTEANYQPGRSWQASIMVAELNAGDGFFEPEEASEIVVKCIVGAFYGENRVERNDTISEARSLQGNDGWYVESDLSFDIDGLQADGELLVVWIVQTSELSSSLFYASIPNNAMELESDARATVDQLQVDP